jgi:ActR/RegA family two-component response regulator
MQAVNNRVLVVDDDADQLSIRSILLARYGLDPQIALDRPSALQLAEAQEFACAVVDLGLPSEAEGLLLIEGLKALRPSLRVVVLTGRSAGRTKAIEGVEAIFEKGMPSGRLMVFVRALCGRVS